MRRVQAVNATPNAFSDRHLLDPPLNYQNASFAAPEQRLRSSVTLGAQITRAAEKNKPDGLLIGCIYPTKAPRAAHGDAPPRRQNPQS
jgi:hypothetical protein